MMKIVQKFAISLFAISAITACSSNESSDNDDFSEDESEFYSSSEVFNFTGNTMKEEYEACKSNPSAQFCLPLAGFNTYRDSGQPKLVSCSDSEENCSIRYLDIEKTKRDERDNSAWIYTPTIKRYGDTYSFGMIRGLEIEAVPPEVKNENGEGVPPESGVQLPQFSAYVAELAWADCENRQVHVVKSSKIKDKNYTFTNPQNYLDNFEDLRSKKIIKTYSVEGGDDIIGVNFNSTITVDKPWRQMLTKVCGQKQDYNYNLPEIKNWRMPDGIYANVQVDINSLIYEDSKTKFWFYVKNYNNQIDQVDLYEKTANGVELVLRNRASRVEVDCDKSTYRMIIDRTSRFSSEWNSNSGVKPIEPKTLIYNMVYSDDKNAICTN